MNLMYDNAVVATAGPRRQFRLHRAYFAIATLAVVAGCSFQNKLVPLHGEDPGALAYSGDRQALLEKTGATIAAERLRKAIRDRDGEACFDLLGPSTRAFLRKQAADSGQDAIRMLRDRKVEGLSVQGAEDPISALATEGSFQVRETASFDPTRRSALVEARIGDGPVLSLQALFLDEGWRIELVRIMTTEIPPGG
jgi:hypothetical protein